jgi:hypothetical protein
LIDFSAYRSPLFSEVHHSMKNATLATILIAALAAAPQVARAGLPEGKIAVIQVTAVDGLASVEAAASETRTSAFSFDGTEYHIARSALSSLEGVQTLLLIDRRTDSMSGDSGVRAFSQEVRSFPSSSFEIKDLDGKNLSYQVAMLGGNLRLLGDGDQIVAKGGPGGPFHVWKITGVDLVDRDAIALD